MTASEPAKLPPLAEVLREKAAAVASWMRDVPTGTPSCSRRAEEAYREAAEMVEARDAELARLRAENAELRRIGAALYECSLRKEPRDMDAAIEACEAWQRIAEGRA